MSSVVVYYRFRSTRDFSSVCFPCSAGNSIAAGVTLCEFRARLSRQHNIPQAQIRVLHHQTHEEYADRDTIPASTSVIVVREPPVVLLPIESTRQQQQPMPIPLTQKEEEAEERKVKLTVSTEFGAQPMKAQASEKDQVRAMAQQAYDGLPEPTQQRVGRGYVCHRCGVAGHLIKQCPTNTDPDYGPLKPHKGMGLLLRPTAALAPEVKPTPQAAQAFDKEAAAAGVPQAEAVPRELECALCRKVLEDALIAPCCGATTCSGCIESAGGQRQQVPGVRERGDCGTALREHGCADGCGCVQGQDCERRR
jgi:hypothetical protein